MTINKGFDAWVDAEKYYIGMPPIIDCKIYPEFCRHKNLAKSQDPSRYFWSRHTGDFENAVAIFLFVALFERGFDV